MLEIGEVSQNPCLNELTVSWEEIDEYWQLQDRKKRAVRIKPQGLMGEGRGLGVCQGRFQDQVPPELSL